MTMKCRSQETSARYLITSLESSRVELTHRLPPVQAFARRWEEHLKGMVMPSTLFEELGFNYIGPIDGHDIHTLVATLNNMKSSQSSSKSTDMTSPLGGRDQIDITFLKSLRSLAKPS